LFDLCPGGKESQGINDVKSRADRCFVIFAHRNYDFLFFSAGLWLLLGTATSNIFFRVRKLEQFYFSIIFTVQITSARHLLVLVMLVSSHVCG
jgi:hypothetical protein